MQFQLLEASTDNMGGYGGLVTIGYVVLIGVALYFFMIRPQKRKQKEEEKIRSNIQIGDEIVTIGGLYMRVVSIKEDTLMVESPVDHSKYSIAKWAVQTNLTMHEDTAAAKTGAKSDKSKKDAK